MQSNKTLPVRLLTQSALRSRRLQAYAHHIHITLIRYVLELHLPRELSWLIQQVLFFLYFPYKVLDEQFYHVISCHACHGAVIEENNILLAGSETFSALLMNDEVLVPKTLVVTPLDFIGFQTNEQLLAVYCCRVGVTILLTNKNRLYYHRRYKRQFTIIEGFKGIIINIVSIDEPDRILIHTSVALYIVKSCDYGEPSIERINVEPHGIVSIASSQDLFVVCYADRLTIIHYSDDTFHTISSNEYTQIRDLYSGYNYVICVHNDGDISHFNGVTTHYDELGNVFGYALKVTKVS